ncbi:MAG: glycoside hydrolase family 5 protein [Beijerinckiaceae bacterium]
MMHKNHFRCAIRIALMLIMQCMLIATYNKAHADFIVRRGIALYEPFMDRSAANQKYFNRTYGDPGILVKDHILRDIKAAGFDTIRLPVAPRPLLEQSEEQFEKSLREIFSGVDLIVAQHMKIILDLHTGHGGLPWQNGGLTRDVDSPEWQRYLNIVSAIAKRLKSYDRSQVAFEPFNEPQGPCRWIGRPAWPRFMKSLYDTIRVQAPDLTVVITGACWGNIDGLIEIEPAQFDRNTLYAFHYYDPHLFSHQGTANSGDAAHYISRITYPPRRDQRSAVQDQLNKNILAAGIDQNTKSYLLKQGEHYIARYFDEPVGPEAFAGRLAKVQTWAKKNAIHPSRIVVGEFGVTKDYGTLKAATPDDRARWFMDARSQFEKAEFGWIAWNYHYQGGVIVGEARGPLDTSIMRALGMRSPKESTR